MILAATGHRPDKLGGYSDAISTRLQLFVIEELRVLNPAETISGMALGWDMEFAEASITLGIPFTAAVPFRGQEFSWPEASQRRYRSLLAKAKRVVEVCDPPYAGWKMMRRNVWMVDNSDVVLALWNGSDGGTGNCVAYAKMRQRQIVNAWDRWVLSEGTSNVEIR